MGRTQNFGPPIQGLDQSGNHDTDPYGVEKPLILGQKCVKNGILGTFGSEGPIVSLYLDLGVMTLSQVKALQHLDRVENQDTDPFGVEKPLILGLMLATSLFVPTCLPICTYYCYNCA